MPWSLWELPRSVCPKMLPVLLTRVVHSPDSWPRALSSDARSAPAGSLSSVGQESEELPAVLGFYETVKYRIGALIIS